MKILFDTMGGDCGISETIPAYVKAKDMVKADIVLLGDEDLILTELKKHNIDSANIVHCSEHILNEDDPMRAVKAKKDCEMAIGLEMVKNGEGNVFVSAGNTGALVMFSALKLRRIGSSKPAITSTIPTKNGICVLLDSGGNTNCDSDTLYSFAVMGCAYSKEVYGIENPRIGLVNIGVEPKKGTDAIRETYAMLQDSNLNFVGNVEAREIPEGVCDVLVCDGFTGNVIIKLMEGMGRMFKNELKNMFKSIGGLVAFSLIAGKIKDFSNRYDYKKYGGVPILGVDGCVIKAHGSSTCETFVHTLVQAEKYANSNVTDFIKENINNN